MSSSVYSLSLALTQFDLEVFSHDTDQVPNDLQVDILGELRQSKEHSTQMHRRRVLLKNFKVDGKCLLDYRIVLLGHFAKVDPNSISFFQL